MTLQLCFGEARVRVNVVDVIQLAVSFLLETMYSDRFIKYIYPAERKIVHYHSR